MGRLLMKITLAATVAVAALSAGMANATHGGDDFTATGSIRSSSPFGRFTPCANATTLAATQGVTQFIVDIPASTWGHDFVLTSDSGTAGFEAYLYARSGATCTKLNEVGSDSGTVVAGTTHAVVVLSSPVASLGEGFTLTVDSL